MTAGCSVGGGCCPGGLLPHLTVGETEAQQGKSSSLSCIESPLLATLTCSSSACPALCSQLPGRGGLLSLPCSEEETKAQQKGEGGPDLWGSQAELYTRSTAWGAGLWGPPPPCWPLAVGASWGQGCSCPPRFMGTGASRSQHIWAGDIMSAGAP